MNVNHILHIRDNAIGALRNFLSTWWLRVELDAMLAPVELPDHGGIVPRVIEHPDDLNIVNPFAPVMLGNTAPMVEGFVKAHPGSHLAVLLRPCELRALVELKKRERVHFNPASSENSQGSLVIFGVDCPGTFLPAEYARHVEQHRDDAEMIKVALSYGSEGSLIPYQVRTACQMCDTPAPIGADVLIGSISTVPKGYLLVIAQDEKVDSILNLRDTTDGMATEMEVVNRELMVGKLADKRTKLRAEMINKQTWQTDDFNSILTMLARCTLCADCLDACPLYEGELTGMLGVRDIHHRTHPLLTELVGVSRWLASCSGCGMCQEACEHGVALTPIVITLSHRIQSELHYKPGDPNQQLPWMV
jgi:formate dehydrogenase subunit beta